MRVTIHCIVLGEHWSCSETRKASRKPQQPFARVLGQWINVQPRWRLPRHHPDARVENDGFGVEIRVRRNGASLGHAQPREPLWRRFIGEDDPFNRLARLHLRSTPAAAAAYPGQAQVFSAAGASAGNHSSNQPARLAHINNHGQAGGLFKGNEERLRSSTWVMGIIHQFYPATMMPNLPPLAPQLLPAHSVVGNVMERGLSVTSGNPVPRIMPSGGPRYGRRSPRLECQPDTLPPRPARWHPPRAGPG